MIIRIDRDQFIRRRYLPKKKNKHISLFFPGANVAFNKRLFDESDRYDERFLAGEDTDFGIHLSRKGELFFSPQARVLHSSNISFRKFISQWIKVGIYHVKVLKKYYGGGIELFIESPAPGEKYVCVYHKKSNLNMVAFLGSFPFFILSLYLSFLLYGLNITALAFLLPIVLGIVYFAKDFSNVKLSILEKIKFGFLRFCINIILLHVSFFVGLKNRLVYVCCEYE